MAQPAADLLKTTESNHMTGSAAQFAQVLAKAAEVAPVLILICRKSDLGIVYVNSAAR